jgi:methionine synthase I (cobalamin-dependent)
MDLLDELETNVLCGDGAMGTLLIAQGIPLERCFEELCVSEPDRIRRIHDAYIGSGARIIETNTFGANAVRLERFGLGDRVAEINRAAARIAIECAANGERIYVAGSVGPLGFSREEALTRGIDRAEVFREQLGALIEAQVDAIFFETFTTFEEMDLALGVKREMPACPTICSFACAPNGQLACGTALADAFGRLEKLGADIMGINCMNDPAGILQLVAHSVGSGKLAVYPTAGFPFQRDGGFAYPVAPATFGDAVPEMIARGAHLIGGCCGTTPAHIAAVSSAVARCR